MRIQVGIKRGDVIGGTSRALQIAADALRANGGGVLEIGPGTYVMEHALRLSSRVRVVGSGSSTILRKCDGPSRRLSIDADYAQLKLTVKDAKPFTVGMELVIGDDRRAGWHATTARVVDVAKNCLHIDTHLVSDYAVEHNAYVRNACSLVAAVDAEDVVIENLVVDGNRGRNEQVNGCRGGGIYLHKAKRCRITGCTVRNFCGDGISWQTTQDIVVEGCTVEGSSGLGVHPGTGSARTSIRGCRIRNNALDGLFLCWRVQDSLVEDCAISRNGRFGISIGHKDTDNLFRRNTVSSNARAGIHFRNEKASNAGSRNRFESNVIEGNGTARPSAAVEILGATADLAFVKNTIRPGTVSPKKGGQRVAFLLGPKTPGPTLRGNRIATHSDGTTQRAPSA